MHAVRRPILGRCYAGFRVEHGLQRYEGGSSTRSHTRRGRAPLIELREPARINGTGAQDERLQHDELQVGYCLSCLLQERGVLVLVILHGPGIPVIELVPEIVHADEDAQHIRFQVQRIGRPPLLEVRHLIPADAAIVKLQTLGRPRCQHPGRNE